MKIATAFVELRVDRKKAEADAKSAAQSAFSAMRNVFAAGVVIKGLNDSVQNASNLNETISKTKVIFGESQRTIEQWSTTSAKAMGISQRAALDAAATFATFGKSAGLAGSDLTGFSQDLVGLSSDLASFYNTSPEDAITAIGAALRGESEPIRQYGVLLDDATLKQRAMTMGIFDGEGALTQQQKVLAAQAEILAQTSDAQGDFARTADGLANSQRIAAAEAENASASFGQTLLPVYDRALEVVTFLVGAFTNLPAPVQTAVVAMAGLVAFSGPIGTVKDLVSDLYGAFVKAGISAGTLSAALGVAGLAIGAAIIGYQVYNQRKQEATDRTLALRDALLSEADAQNQALKDLIESDENFERLAQSLKTLGLSFDDVNQYMRDGTGPAKAIVDAWDQAGEAADGTYPTLDAFAKILGLSSDMTYDQIAALRDAGYEFEHLRAEQVKSEQQQALLNDVTGQSVPVIEDAAAATDVLADATEDVGKRQKEAADKAREQRDAIADLYSEIIGQIDAQRAYERSVDDSEQAIADYNAVLLDQESTLEDVQDAARGTMDQFLDTAAAYRDSKGAAEGSAAGVDLMIESLYNQALALAPDSLLRKQLLDYIAELQKIPTQIDTHIRLNVTGQTVTKSGDIIGIRAVGTQAVYNADGSYIDQPTLSWVGEGGKPEVVLPLSKPNRLVELLSDPRVGGPISQALGSGSGGSSPMGGGSATTVINNTEVKVYGAEEQYVMDLRRKLYDIERGQS
jgi:hypothetical protein